MVFFWTLFEQQMVQTLILVHEYYLGLCWFGHETYSTSSVWNTELKYLRLENECSNNTFHIRASPLQKEGPATSCSFHFWTSPWNWEWAVWLHLSSILKAPVAPDGISSCCIDWLIPGVKAFLSKDSMKAGLPH